MLDPPTSLTAADGATITLNWTATPDTYAAGYRVLRSVTSGGPYSQIAQVTPRTSTSYVDAPASGTYYYVAKAYFQNWESGTSAEAVATVSAGGGVTRLGSWVTGTTHVAEAGSDRALVVVVAREGGTLDLTAVSYGGQALTQAVQVENASGTTRARVEIWVLTDAAITAASDAVIGLTWAGAAGSSVMVDSAFFGGVEQAAAIGPTGSNAIIGDTPTTIATPALSTATGDMVVYGVVSGNAISYTPLNGFSEGNDQQVGATATLATGDKSAARSSETPSADADAAPRRQVIAGLFLAEAGPPVASAAVSGTITPTATEAEIVAGGKTLILTLTNETWDAAIGADNAQTTALIAGIDSAQAEASGWDAVVKANLTFNEVVRTSATVVTITLAAEASYDINAAETITVTVPASAVVGGSPIGATPTLTVTTGCAAGDTGFQNAAAQTADSGGDDGDGFEQNPTNAFADGGGYAYNDGAEGDRHRYYDYGLSIPNGCVIAGIEVRVDWWLGDLQDTNHLAVQLSWNGGSSWTATQSDTQETLSQHTGILGGALDTWGRTWSIADFTDANFRLRVIATGDEDYFLDWITVKVYYTP